MARVAMVPAPPARFGQPQASAIGMPPRRPSMALAPPQGLHGLFRGMVAANPSTAGRIENASPSDPLDQVLLVYLERLAQELPHARVRVRKLGQGCYDIDGQRVFLRMGIGRKFARDRPLVREDSLSGKAWPAAEEHDLMPYLRQAAHVSSSLRETATLRIPKDLRISFAETEAPGAKTTLRDIRRGLVEDGAQRCESMRLACQQAQMREQAASMFETGPLWRSLSSNLGYAW
mmetsp:Transcript_7826/g.22462  ORF Transcript_7826/g.22462 Transcript_7826/m.22462 type:complete len:233 (+) Transcript_7826:44-742(+)